MTRPREVGVTAALLGPLLAGDSGRPRITWYGAGRTELSTASASAGRLAVRWLKPSTPYQAFAALKEARESERSLLSGTLRSAA